MLIENKHVHYAKKKITITNVKFLLRFKNSEIFCALNF